MFSALKRLAKRGDENKATFPSGVAVMNPNMQKKFAKGIQYNMKIVLKGDRNTGKSCLLARLQGGAFREEYIPTHEIQVACINWNYRGSDEVVKVEVWDIVDKAHRKRRKSSSLKVAHEDVQAEESDSDGVALDAEFLDVFKGTHGVIMLLDITKTWTWSYVERELPKIPHHIPVLVMANFRDMGTHRVIDEDRILAFIEHLDRPLGAAEIYYSESSLKNGFGLRYIYRFLNMPFLILQRETLLRQLEANALEIEDYRECLQFSKENEDQNYEKFLEMLEQRKSERAKSPKREQEASSSPVAVNGHGVADGKASNESSGTLSPVQSPSTSSMQETTTGKKQPGKETTHQVTTNDQPLSPVSEVEKAIAELQLDEEIDPSFLGDTSRKIERPKENVLLDSSSDDEGNGNPLVEDYQDLSSEEETPQPVQEIDQSQPQPVYEVSENEDLSDHETPPTVIVPVAEDEAGESSSEDEGMQYVITGNIDIDSEPELEDKPCKHEKIMGIESIPDINPSLESPKDLDSFTSDLSLIGLDHFMAEQLSKAASLGEDTQESLERTPDVVDSEAKEVKKKKKKKKSKKDKIGEEDTEKSKKKKKTKDPSKKKKSVDKTNSENADYELL